jgi:hypothetical protein
MKLWETLAMSLLKSMCALLTFSRPFTERLAIVCMKPSELAANLSTPFGR